MKAAIFDVDGTLVDSVDLHARAWQEAFREFGHDLDLAEVRSQIGKGGDQLMPVFLSPEELEQKGKALEQFRSNLFKTKYFHLVKPFPKVRELFQQLLEHNWKIALASSAKGDELDTYKNLVEIADLLDTQTSSDDADQSKPHPDIFLAAAERLKNVHHHDCIVVGDSPYDAEAAGKAGMRAIGFLSGHFPETQLRNSGCTEIYRDAEDLLQRYRDSVFASAT